MRRGSGVRPGLVSLVLLMMLAASPVVAEPAAPTAEPRDSRIDVGVYRFGALHRSIEARYGIDFETARQRASDLPQFDYEIDQEDLGAWAAAIAANPVALDGLTIQVVLDPPSHALASPAADRLQATGSSRSLTQEQQLAIMRLGGPGAALLDETMDAETAPPPPVTPGAAAPCAAQPVSPTPGTDAPVGYLLCVGMSPVARPIALTLDPDLTDDARILAALGAIAHVTPEQGEQGLYSLLTESMIAAVTVDGTVATVDFTAELAQAHFGGQGLDLLEQVVNTVFAVSDATMLNLTLDGSCKAFALAVGGDTCHTNLDSERTNTERAQDQ